MLPDLSPPLRPHRSVSPDPVRTGNQFETPVLTPTPEGSQDPPMLADRASPIPPPSETMQYRAIGLVEGQYIPSAEQFTRGVLKTEDGSELDAVLLGRVMNLVRKHLEPEKPYLWVVYPRTREKENTLHLQIMGVWAPVEMGQEVSEDLDPKLVPNYFSVRGEVVFQSQEKGFVVVKIRTAKKSAQNKPLAFKLKLEGQLPAKGVGHFWELEVYRHGIELQIASGTLIAAIPKPKPKPPRKPTKPIKVADRQPEPPPISERPIKKVEKPIKKKRF